MTEAEWLTCDDPHGLFNWLCRSHATDRYRLGLLFGACCDCIPPSAAEETAHTPTGGHWTDDDSSQIALADEAAEYHLTGAVLEAMRAIGAGESERRVLAALIRDIFGNPFRAVTFSDSWRTDTALSLAKQMYESRDFSAMPILADALQDAGCDNEGILNHCRDTSATHVRGCWVVDLVLGKK